MMDLFKAWSEPTRDEKLSKSVRREFAMIKQIKDGISTDDIMAQIVKLKNAVVKLKQDGISMWNYKQAIPKIFDIVDGAFEVMVEVVRKIDENNQDKKVG